MKQIKQVLGTTHHIPKIDENGLPYTHHDFSAQIELTSQDFEKYLLASQALASFNRDMQLFKIILWNLKDYFDTIENYRIAFANRTIAYPDNKQPDLEINRRLINFLTSVTTYLTYSENLLSQKYGEQSSNFENFKQYTAHEFDNHFSYRFLYHLRNYAQHGGLPITELNFISQPIDDNPLQQEHMVKVGILRDKLFQGNFTWKATVRKELQEGPHYIDINTHLITFANCLSSINSQLVQDEFSTLVEPATYLHELTQRIEKIDGDINVFELEVTTNEEGTVTKVIPTIIHRLDLELINAAMNQQLQEETTEFTYSH